MNPLYEDLSRPAGHDRVDHGRCRTSAGVCVLVDAISPSGQLRNAHKRALHQLRELKAKVTNDWRIGKLSGKEPNALAAGILTAAQKEREKISRDLQAAETSFGKRGKQA